MPADGQGPATARNVNKEMKVAGGHDPDATSMAETPRYDQVDERSQRQPEEAQDEGVSRREARSTKQAPAPKLRTAAELGAEAKRSQARKEF